MEALELLKIKNRMCEGGCSTCPASMSNNGYDVACATLMEEEPEQYIKIVERWGESHPPKTRAEKLKELFPNVDTFCGAPRICPLIIEGKVPKELGCAEKLCTDCFKEYWEGEYVQK